MTFENGRRLIFHFVTCTIIILLVKIVNCEQSVELDYEQEYNSSSYDYDEESTVERLSHGSESEEPQEPDDPVLAKSYIENIRPNGSPRLVPIFDKDGKRVKSDEIYAEMHKRKIEKMYYDSEGKRVTIPILLREEDFCKANLTKILDWIEWIDGMRATILDMKEKATSCTPQSHEEVKGYDSVPVMLKDIQDALKTLDECENKLNDQLRDPAKQWNYPSEKKSKIR